MMIFKVQADQVGKRHPKSCLKNFFQTRTKGSLVEKSQIHVPELYFWNHRLIIRMACQEAEPGGLQLSAEYTSADLRRVINDKCHDIVILPQSPTKPIFQHKKTASGTPSSRPRLPGIAGAIFSRRKKALSMPVGIMVCVF